MFIVSMCKFLEMYMAMKLINLKNTIFYHHYSRKGRPWSHFASTALCCMIGVPSIDEDDVKVYTITFKKHLRKI